MWVRKKPQHLLAHKIKYNFKLIICKYIIESYSCGKVLKIEKNLASVGICP